MLAHSMGGAIGALYLDKFHRGSYAVRFDAAALSSPMMTIDTRPYGPTFAATFAHSGCNASVSQDWGLNQVAFSGSPTFAPPNNPDNSVTSSQNRFTAKVNLFNQISSLQLGGVTWGWLCQWLGLAGGTGAMSKMGPNNSTPTLLFQASEGGDTDGVVQPSGQTKYCSEAPACQAYAYPTAFHELLQENDTIRNLTMTRTVKFFNHFVH